MTETTQAWLKMTPAERAAFYGHQIAVQDRDRDKRRRAMKKYRMFLDYLTDVGRITERERQMLEVLRLPRMNNT